MASDICERCNRGEQHVYCCHNCEKFAAEIAVLSVEKRDLKASYDESMKTGLVVEEQRDRFRMALESISLTTTMDIDRIKKFVERQLDVSSEKAEHETLLP
jgi:hypothetical protein